MLYIEQNLQIFTEGFFVLLYLVVFISYRKMSEYEIKMFILFSIYSMLYTERKTYRLFYKRIYFNTFEVPLHN